MSASNETAAGSLSEIWRYPVKSMAGEKLDKVQVTERGILGDRAFALVDQETGKVASAKNPRKWAQLLDMAASYARPPQQNEDLPKPVITLPSGDIYSGASEETNLLLSRRFGRDVRLENAPPLKPALEEYWPDIEGLDHREVVTDEDMPPGTFFDCGVIHFLTTATLERLRELYPDGRFVVRRFRPNLLIEPVSGAPGFVENDWVKRRIAIGDAAIIEITGPCPRCVMTTLPQADLPKDPGILRAAARYNGANVGVYATVIESGEIRQGDPVRLV